MRQRSGEADIQPSLVEANIAAAMGRETHQPGASIWFHISAVIEPPDTPKRFTFGVERPGDWFAEKVALQHSLDGRTGESNLAA